MSFDDNWMPSAVPVLDENWTPFRTLVTVRACSRASVIIFEAQIPVFYPFDRLPAAEFLAACPAELREQLLDAPRLTWEKHDTLECDYRPQQIDAARRLWRKALHGQDQEAQAQAPR